jgi:O-acetylhomoserine (thiol)-lyase
MAASADWRSPRGRRPSRRDPHHHARGQNFISATSLYGGTWTLFTQTLKKLGVEVRFFNPDHPEEIGKLVDENTRLVYLESVGNPKNDVPDFRAIADEAHKHGLPVIVDNTVLTPALFRPFEHGIDIAVYSTTKFLGGHGVHIGGAIVDSGNFQWAENPKKWPEFTEPSDSYHGVVFTEALKPLGNLAYIIHIRTHWLRDTGGTQSPFAAFLLLLGIETLHLRMERHVRNAQAVAEWLLKHPAVTWVNYPGLPNHSHYQNAKKYLPQGAGAILGFGVRGGKAAGVKFINSVKLSQPPGECRRRQDAGDSSGVHHAFPAYGEGTGRDRSHAGLCSRVGRDRRYRRHQGRSGPGLRLPRSNSWHHSKTTHSASERRRSSS